MIRIRGLRVLNRTSERVSETEYEIQDVGWASPVRCFHLSYPSCLTYLYGRGSEYGLQLLEVADMAIPNWLYNNSYCRCEIRTEESLLSKMLVREKLEQEAVEG